MEKSLNLSETKNTLAVIRAIPKNFTYWDVHGTDKELGYNPYISIGYKSLK